MNQAAEAVSDGRTKGLRAMPLSMFVLSLLSSSRPH